MLLFYIRHGTPTYNPDALTPLGHRQAEAVARRLSVYGVDKIYSSTCNRAYETAVPTAEILGKEITRVDFANEEKAWGYCGHDLQGENGWVFHKKKFIEIFARNDVRALGREWHTHPAFEGTHLGEGIKKVQRETDEFLLSLGYEHDLENNCYRAVRSNDERVALFAHQGFGLAFLSCVLDIPYPVFATCFDMTHTGMTVIEFKGDDIVYPKTLELSGDGHLYREGLMTGYNNGIKF